jgi:transposase
MRYVGIDVGKARCRAALMNQKGIVESEFFFENSNRGIANLVSALIDVDSVVMESSGNLWLNIYDALDSKSIKVVLANLMKTKAIACARALSPPKRFQLNLSVHKILRVLLFLLQLLQRLSEVTFAVSECSYFQANISHQRTNSAQPCSIIYMNTQCC